MAEESGNIYRVAAEGWSAKMVEGVGLSQLCLEEGFGMKAEIYGLCEGNRSVTKSIDIMVVYWRVVF